MVGGLIFTLGCILPLILIDLIYLLQKKDKLSSTIIFKIFILVDILMIISEIACTGLLDNNKIVMGELFLRIHWFFAVMYFYFMFVYAYTILKNIDADSVKNFFIKNITILIVTIFVVIIGALYFISPLPKIDYTIPNFLPGWLAYVVIGFAMCEIGILSVVILRTKNKPKHYMYMYLTIVVIASAYLVLQYFFQKIAFGPVAASFIIIIFYMIRENPNITMIDDMNKINNALQNNNNITAYLLSNINNEIKTKLNNITNLTFKYVGDEEINKEELSKDIISIIKNCKSVIFSITNRLNLFSFIQNRGVNYTFDVQNVINSFHKFAYSMLDGSGIRLIINIEENTPRKIIGNEDAFYYILVNSFLTAYNTTKIGRIVITIKGEEDSVFINVSDTGEGRKEEEYSNIEKYDMSYFMVRKYLEAYGGRYSVSGKLNVGTSIDMNLNVVRASEDNIDKQTLEEAVIKDDIINMKQKKAIIVENNILYSKSLNQIFNLYNFNVNMIDNLDTLMNQIKQENSCDFVFVDMLIDSHEKSVAKDISTLCNDFGVTKPKIIALVPYKTTSKELEYKNNGFDACIELGIDTEELNRYL